MHIRVRNVNTVFKSIFLSQIQSDAAYRLPLGVLTEKRVVRAIDVFTLSYLSRRTHVFFTLVIFLQRFLYLNTNFICLYSFKMEFILLVKKNHKGRVSISICTYCENGKLFKCFCLRLCINVKFFFLSLFLKR